MTMESGGKQKDMDHHEIATSLYETSYLVESQIVGQKDEAVCDWWARKNAFRHAFTAASLLQFAQTRAGQPISIFNLSGLSCGHQDFALCGFLRHLGIPFKYVALEHPSSPYLSMPIFKDQVALHGIQIIFADLRELRAEELVSQTGTPDVILFTEIAEHLEHSALLKAFQAMSTLLADDGRVVLTTPNMDYWRYRLRHLVGKPPSHWGEGLDNMGFGLFGHIVYYGIPRLRHLLADCGLRVTHARTFNFPCCTPGQSTLAGYRERIALGVTNALISTGEHMWRFTALMEATRTLGEVIYLEAGKGTRQEIPFAL